MNTQSKNKKDKENMEAIVSLRNLLNNRTPERQIELDAFMLMAKFLSDVEIICKERGILKKDLAKQIGTSASYLTQLYRGDKLINLSMIAKISYALNMKTEIFTKELPVAKTKTKPILKKQPFSHAYK